MSIHCAFCKKDLVLDGAIAETPEGIQSDGLNFCDIRCLQCHRDEQELREEADKAAAFYKCEKSFVHHPVSCRIGRIMLQIQNAKPEDFPVHVQIGEDGFTIKNTQEARTFALGMLAMGAGIDREQDVTPCY